MDKAQSYVASVKEAFRAESEKFDEFVKIAMDAKDHKYELSSPWFALTFNSH